MFDGQPVPMACAADDATPTPGPVDITRLFHQLNNQLGIILANAELLENRLADPAHRARAAQVVASALDAIDTVRRVRALVDLS